LSEPLSGPPPGPLPGPPAGLFTFSIEGRRAPALFVTGWLATVLGLGLTLVAFLSGPGGATPLLFLSGFAFLSIGFVLLGGSQTVERAGAGLAYAGPSPVVVFGALISTTLLVAVLVGIPLDLAGVRLERPVGDLVGTALQAMVFIGVVRLMVVAPGALRWADMGLALDARRAVAALVGGAAYAVPLVLLTTVVGGLAIRVLGQAPPSPLPPTGTATGLALHLVAGAVIAPFAEEIVFRGVAVTAWARSAGPVAAIARSSVLFVAAHVLGIGGDTFGQAAALAAVAAIGRLPVAIVLGWLYLRRGTIWASIGLHASFNAILIVLSETL
jgi:membrane protease YdiL (CAAX protease family)